MSNAYEKRILRVIDYIFEHTDGDLSLDNLADVAAMSRFHWHRVFHGVTGETCAVVVRRVRLHRAALWLVREDWAIDEIARRVGYPNVQSFTRAFHVAYGVGPAAFRKTGTADVSELKLLKGKYEMFAVALKETTPRRIIGMAHKGAYIEIGHAFEKLSAVATSRGLWPDVKASLGVYYDDPSAVAEAELRSFAGLEVDAEMPLPEGLEEMEISAGKSAVLRLKGPYSGLQAAYTYLYGDWLPNSGYEMRDEPCYEVYLNSPANTAPDDLVTEIYVPLKG